MPRNNERGIAIVMALFLVSALSVLAAGMMFLSQTETYASMNYRMMSQARYAAEAGVHKAANFLLDSTQYAVPGTTADPLTNYDRTVSPVKYNGQPVILSAVSTQASNYPVGSVQTAFNNAAKGTLTAGNATLSYGAYAKLMSMQTFESYGGGQAVVQTWEITADGTLAGSRPATVEVLATVETPKVVASSYAAFATANTCSAMYFHGNVDVDSYDSSAGPPGTCTGCSTQSSGGNVGTNGNMEVGGNAVDVMGNLYTPRTGVGSCSNNGTIPALTGKSGTIWGSVVQLPTEVSYPTPTFTTVPPTTAVTVNSTLLSDAATACSSLGLTSGTNCTVDAANKTVTVDGHGAEVTMPSVTVASGFKLVFVGHATPPAVVNINAMLGSGDIEIQANMGATNANEAVVIKVSGKNADGTEMEYPFDLSEMGWKQNATANAASKYDASAFQIVYGGSGRIYMDGGNSQSAATIYAPNASFLLKGTQDLYGSILARTIENEGNASIHYDRRLKKDFYVAGHSMAGTFTWKRY